jgi:hypothetical protein
MRRMPGHGGMFLSAAFLMIVNYAFIKLHGKQRIWQMLDKPRAGGEAKPNSR